VFATLVGRLPDPPTAAGHAEAAVEARLTAQIEAGIELLSDAEPVAVVGAGVDGSSPAEVVDRWRRTAAVASRTGGGAVKAAILGPYSAGRRVGRAGRGRGDEAAAAAREAVVRLLEAGCPFVEVHEPAAVSIGADAAERAAFRESHERLTDGLDGHLCLAITGGAADAAGADTVFVGGYRSYLFDVIDGPDNWRLIANAPATAGIVAGALDHRPSVHEVPETLVWAAHYAASTAGRGADRVGISNGRSLAALPWEVALERLQVLGAAARIAALPPGESLGRALDPRAVDIRSAAVGRYAPLRRRRASRRGAPKSEGRG
jgi:hypothetical protein